MRMNKERAKQEIIATRKTFADKKQKLEEKNEFQKSELKRRENKSFIHLYDNKIKALDIAIDSLDNEWVDVRKELPSESENVLITCFYCYSGEYEVTLGHCENGEWYYTDERVLISNADSTEENSAQIVIAWKPLPKPYERKE